MQLLLVEDDASLAQGLCQALRGEGFSVNHVLAGAEALAAVATEQPDVMILDLGLPDMDGLEVLQALRADRVGFPILVLTARDSLQDKVSGLDQGADDYLAKPFDMPELVARLRVLSRRNSVAHSHVIEFSGVTMDVSAHAVSVDGEPVGLSHREFALLQVLLQNPGHIQSREKLESRLYAWGEEVASNAIEVHIHHLRKKLPKGLIKTVRGVGYTLHGDGT